MSQHKRVSGMITSIVLVAILAGAVFGNANIQAFAWNDTNNKCPDKYKYGNICDKKDPNLQIFYPDNGEKVSKGQHTFTGTCTDSGSGVKKVNVQLDNLGIHTVSLVAGHWTYDTKKWGTPLTVGNHKLTATCWDKVNNEDQDHVSFKAK